MGGEYAVTTLEQKRQLESLNTLSTSLTGLLQQHTIELKGLSLRLYHPEVAPSQSRMTTDENGDVTVKTETLKVCFILDAVQESFAMNGTNTQFDHGWTILLFPPPSGGQLQGFKDIFGNILGASVRLRCWLATA